MHEHTHDQKKRTLHKCLLTCVIVDHFEHVHPPPPPAATHTQSTRRAAAEVSTLPSLLTCIIFLMYVCMRACMFMCVSLI